MGGTSRDVPQGLVTVVVPAWNSGSTLARAVDSVLVETAIPLECVVVDDGSSDDTSAVAAAIAARDPRLVLVRLRRNGGVSNARNEGLRVARGTWLTFLDADDRLLPGAIAALVRPTEDPAVRAVVGQRTWSDGSRTWRSGLYDIPDIRQPGRKSIATHPGLLYYASGTGKLLHRSLLDGLRFQGRVLGDQPWTIRALLRAGEGIEVIADDVYEWSRPPRGVSRPTITAATRASAAASARSARIARSAFLQVAAEADEQLRDEGTALAVKRAYAVRLVRSDFQDALRRAVDRRDPGLARLFVALGGLLDAMPPAVIRGSPVVVDALLRPGWQHWRELPPSAQRAWWRMLMPVLRADRRLAGRLVGSSRLVPALGVARRATFLHPALGSLAVRGIRRVGAWRRRRRAGRAIREEQPARA